MDFNSQDGYTELGIDGIWASSTAIACIPMVIAFVYIVVEWCMQSHLSTVDYEKAGRGLSRTRIFRRLINPIQHGLYLTSILISTIWRKTVPKSMARPKKSALIWTSRPRITIQPVGISDSQLESAIDDQFFSAGGNHKDEGFGLVQLSSPSRSVNRSRSSFGQGDVSEVSRPKPFI